MKEKKEILSYTINILLVIVLAVLLYRQFADRGGYDYCLEWNNSIHREDLPWKCYNAELNKYLCYWNIYGDMLAVMDYEDPTRTIGTFDCTEWTKTRR